MQDRRIGDYMALNDLIKPAVIRLTQKDGRFGAEYDWRRGEIRLVSRGGTVDYDLVAIAAEMQAREQAEQAQPL